MLNIADVVFWVCLAGVFVVIVVGFRKNAGLLVFGLVAVASSGAIYFFVFQSRPGVQSKGEQPNQLAFIVVLFVCMLAGMTCHYFYVLLSKPKQRRGSFDFASFIAPIFASPIVFIPLLASFQNADVDLTKLTLPKIMVFFVAFENGFFWKELVDNRRKELSK